ncbi:MAG: chromate transporter [Spirochaetia bacterium]|jgi:chromate transporter|nr:chromate transporter [Spirochaetales bacterium]MDX9783375.1 chromate transporter [Spirochaetia bacterium]
MQILEIIWTFFKIGIVSFGGGWSIVGIIRNEVVPRWINEQEFLSLIAVAQSTPGPIALNAATMIGWEYGGFFTAMAATLSVVAFPVIAILVATYLARFIKLRAAAINESLKTGSIAMMLMALWALKPSSADPLLIAMALGAFALAAFTKINALWAILGSGALNAIAGPAIRALLGIGG